MPLAMSALNFAHRAHAGQFRDGDSAIPYLHHPLEVAHLLRWIGGVAEESQIAAALLHDTVEEGGAALSEIESEFGSRVSTLVSELTRTEPALDQIASLTKKEVYELRTNLMLSDIDRMSPEAQRIKLADRLSNWREAKLVRSSKRLDRYRTQTKQILKAIPRRVSPRLWDTLFEECDSE